MFVSDLRHYLDLPADAPGPALRMADRLGRIVSAGTAGDIGSPWVSAIRCERRPGRRPCPGFIEVARSELPASIRWRCTACGDDGVVSGWEDSPFDLRPSGLRAAGAQVQLVLDAETVAVLHRIPMLAPDCDRLVFRARVVDGGVLLAGSVEDFDELAGYLAAEANHATHRRHQQHLDDAVHALEEALVLLEER